MITEILWSSIVFFVGMSFVVGVGESLWLLFLVLGVLAFVVGILLISSSRFTERFYHLAKKNTVYEKLFSSKQRYFLDRFYSGSRIIIAGAGVIFLYWITHQQVFAAIEKLLAGFF